MIKSFLNIFNVIFIFTNSCKALACSPLPYEKVIKNLVSFILFISFKFLLASISDWPPDKNAILGTSLGTFF